MSLLSSFDLETVSKLEERLSNNNEYSLELNLHLLKLYSFFPDACKIPFVSQILFKALEKLPSTDFLLCAALITDRVLKNQAIAPIFDMADLLERTNFVSFWKKAAENKSLLPSKFEESVREFISGVIVISFQTIKRSVLENQLNLTGQQLNDFANKHGWEINNDLVNIPLSENNQAYGRHTKDSIQLKQIATAITRYDNHIL